MQDSVWEQRLGIRWCTSPAWLPQTFLISCLGPFVQVLWRLHGRPFPVARRLELARRYFSSQIWWLASCWNLHRGLSIATFHLSKSQSITAEIPLCRNHPCAQKPLDCGLFREERAYACMCQIFHRVSYLLTRLSGLLVLSKRNTELHSWHRCPSSCCFIFARRVGELWENSIH